MFASPHVFVVDDLPDAADSMALLLNLCGYECESHHGGESALSSARFRRPDIVLLDLCMPKMDGFEFVVRLREVLGCSGTPIVMISGVRSDVATTRAQELEIAHCFLKPVDLASLLKVMKDVLAASAVELQRLGVDHHREALVAL